MQKLLKVLIVIIIISLLLVNFYPNTRPALYSRVESAQEKSAKYIMSQIKNDQYWAGDVFFYDQENSDQIGETAGFVILNNYLKIKNNRTLKALKYILDNQKHNGSWGSTLATFKNILALETTNKKAYASQINRAKEYLEKKGTKLENMPISLRIIYAFFNHFPVDKINPKNPIPIISNETIKKLEKVNDPTKLNQGLINVMLTLIILKNTKIGNKHPALDKIGVYLAENQLINGSWFSVLDQTERATMALNLLDPVKYKSNIQKAIKFAEGLQRDNGQVMAFYMPAFGTALVYYAFQDGDIFANDPRIEKAGEYIRKAKYPLGGFGASQATAEPVTADADDSAFGFLALAYEDLNYSRRTIKYLFDIQNNDGGWGTYEKNAGKPFAKKFPLISWSFGSSGDVTGHVLFALGANKYSINNKKIKKAIIWAKKTQFKDGKWFGYWGINYIYGTHAMLTGLNAVGEDMKKPYIQRAVNWLKAHQNNDGGWGETLKAFDDIRYAGKGESTPQQTALALDALLEADESIESRTVIKGLKYLIGTQKKDGTWVNMGLFTLGEAKTYTDTIICQIIPLLALNEYINKHNLSERANLNKSILNSLLISFGIFLAISIKILSKENGLGGSPI